MSKSLRNHIRAARRKLDKMERDLDALRPKPRSRLASWFLRLFGRRPPKPPPTVKKPKTRANKPWSIT